MPGSGYDGNFKMDGTGETEILGLWACLVLSSIVAILIWAGLWRPSRLEGADMHLD